jgi:hypothetical protein
MRERARLVSRRPRQRALDPLGGQAVIERDDDGVAAAAQLHGRRARGVTVRAELELDEPADRRAVADARLDLDSDRLSGGDRRPRRDERKRPDHRTQRCTRSRNRPRG